MSFKIPAHLSFLQKKMEQNLIWWIPHDLWIKISYQFWYRQHGRNWLKDWKRIKKNNPIIYDHISVGKNFVKNSMYSWLFPFYFTLKMKSFNLWTLSLTLFTATFKWLQCSWLSIYIILSQSYFVLLLSLT